MQYSNNEPAGEAVTSDELVGGAAAVPGAPFTLYLVPGKGSSRFITWFQ